ncbi:MAG: hypothetical protein FGM46_09570 [Ferruginibacter sp.]|nr:hypothetical protein [Ferruginibacter sp.]
MGLFDGSSSTSFKSEKPLNEITEQIQDFLENIGPVDIYDNGKIKIDAKKYNNFSCESTIDGSIREKNGKYTIELNYEAKMTTLAWVLTIVGIIIWLLGLLILIFPNMSKNEMKKKIEKTLDEIRYEYK